jgi:hypothetical protein
MKAKFSVEKLIQTTEFFLKKYKKIEPVSKYIEVHLNNGVLCYFVENKQGVLKECVSAIEFDIGDRVLVENISRVKSLLKFLKDLRKDGIDFVNLEIENGAWDFKVEQISEM